MAGPRPKPQRAFGQRPVHSSTSHPQRSGFVGDKRRAAVFSYPTRGCVCHRLAALLPVARRTPKPILITVAWFCQFSPPIESATFGPSRRAPHRPTTRRRTKQGIFNRVPPAASAALKLYTYVHISCAISRDESKVKRAAPPARGCAGPARRTFSGVSTHGAARSGTLARVPSSPHPDCGPGSNPSWAAPLSVQRLLQVSSWQRVTETRNNSGSQLS